jgi:hypothetical protein
VLQSRIWRRLAADGGIVGYIRALEVMYGGFAGWHPHLHVLVFFGCPLTPEQRTIVRDALSDEWMLSVTRELGIAHRPSFERGVDMRPCTNSGYLTKMGLDSIAAELTDVAGAKRGTGGHLTPWQIAQRAAGGNVRYQHLWQEYTRAMHGAKQLTWSKGLRALYPVPEEEKEPEPELVASISSFEWMNDNGRPGVRDARLPDGRLARLVILAVVEAGGGRDEVRAIVDAVVRARMPERRGRSEPPAPSPQLWLQRVEGS